MKQVLKVETKVARILHEMSTHGWVVDRDKMEYHISHLHNEMDKVDAEILPSVPKKLVLPYPKPIMEVYKKDGSLKDTVIKWYGEDASSIVQGPFTRVAFETLNLGSDKQVKEFLFTQGWEPTEWNFKKDKKGKPERDPFGNYIKTSPKLTEDSYDSIKGEIGVSIAHRMKCSHRASQLEGWLSKIREDGRLPQIINGITPTARARHQIIVNVPGEKAFYGREMREVFTVPEGYKQVGCDAKGCQLRFLAHYMEDDEYTRQTLETDPHSVTSEITGLSRDDSKTFIYALLFGAGIPKLAKQLGKSTTATQKIKDLFLDNLPKLKSLLNYLDKMASSKKYLNGLDGRKVPVDSSHKALNYLLQSAEGILMRYALCILDTNIKKGGYDAHLVGWIHDEFQLEVREDQAEEVAKLSREAIEKAGKYLKVNIPMTGDPKIGNNWKDTH